MTYVQYTGPGDMRILGTNDFAKAGVEHDGDFEFPTGQPVEVPSEVADALINHPLFVPEMFEEVKESEEDNDQSELDLGSPDEGSEDESSEDESFE